MVQSLDIKIKTKTDTKEAKDLKTLLDGMKDVEVNIKTDVDDKDIKSTKKEVDDLKGEQVDIDANVDDSEIQTAQSEIDDMNGEKVAVDIDVDDSQLKSARVTIDDMNGEKIAIDLDVDTSQLDEAERKVSSVSSTGTSGLNNIGSSVNGIVGMMAGKSIWDTIYGTSKKAETNKILLKNMADTSVAYENLYSTIDKTTDSSLISMQQLIPALNGIKSATGSTGETINSITPGVASFGQYVYALTGSSAKAEQAMFDLSKGIKGAYASLDQYGITEDALMRTGLWNGKEDDVQGYIAAVNKVTGSTDELMSSTQGLEALMGKAYSRAGKNLGQYVLPEVQKLLNGFLDLDSKTNGWLSTITLGAGGVISGLQTAGVAISQVAQGYRDVKGAYDWAFGEDGKLSGIRDKLSSIKDAASNVGSKIKSIGSSITSIDYAGKFNGLKNSLTSIASSARTAAASFASTLKNALVGVASAAKSAAVSLAKAGVEALKAGANALRSAAMWAVEKAQKLASAIASKVAAAAQWLLNAAMSANPIMLVVIAIIALIGILWYLYNTNEGVRNAIDGFAQALMGIAQTIYGTLVGAFEWLSGAWQNTVNFFTNGANTINDSVNGALTWLTEGLQWLADTITGSVMGAVQWLTDGLQWLSDLISGSLMVAVQWLTDQFTWLSDTWNTVVNLFMTYAPLVAQVLFVMATGGVGAIVLLIANFMGMPNQVGQALQNVINRVAGFVGDIVGRLGNGARQAVSNFVSGIAALPGRVYSELQKTLDRVMEWGGQIVSRLGSIAQQAWQAFVSGLGIGSPGYIQILTLKELDDTGKRIPTVAGRIVDNLGKMAGEAVDAWGTPKFDTLFDMEGAGEFNIDKITGNNTNSNVTNLLGKIIEILSALNGNGDMIFNLYGDMDNEDRMEKFLDAVRRDLNWDNDTAGRTV